VQLPSEVRRAAPGESHCWQRPGAGVGRHCGPRS
jgi:hypothetical protein